MSSKPSDHREDCRQRLDRLYRRVSHLCQTPWSRLQTQDRLSWSRRIRPRRGRRWLLRGPRQHPRGLLVAPAILAAAASRPLAGEAAALSRLLPVRSQCSQTRKGFAWLLDRGAGRLSPLPITPQPDKSPRYFPPPLTLATASSRQFRTTAFCVTTSSADRSRDIARRARFAA